MLKKDNISPRTMNKSPPKVKRSDKENYQTKSW